LRASRFWECSAPAALSAERPSEDASAHQGDERASVHHWRISSARTSTDLGDGEPKGLSGLEVDHQLVLGRRLHWQIVRLLALKETIDVSRGSSLLFELIASIGDEAAARRKIAKHIDRRQAIPRSQPDDQVAIPDGERIREND